MSQRYNGFVSYRHGPLDSKIAARVQRQLEHFRVPKAIAKATGMKKIERIFRDKDELGMAGELNENIEQALINAEYLIVICSHATKESVWVQKEIELFLKTHSPNRVLAVLAEGEPADVVPEILRYREVEVEDDDGVMQTVKVPREALLCDYRVSPAKAKREELPRLAAALLGCTYDDLRQRQRHYRNRRIAAAGIAAGVAMAGLAAYYAWSANQIQENYWKSLRNQSAYLASEAQKQLDSGDRLTAMLLALHALPEEAGERPVVPSAVHALTEATDAYTVPGHDRLVLDRAFVIPGVVDNWYCDWERNCLVVEFANYKVTVLDMNTGETLFLETYEDGVRQTLWTDRGDLLVLIRGSIFCYDGTDFSLLWERTDLDQVESALSAGETIVTENRDVLYVLDAATGKTIRTAALPEMETEETVTTKLMAVSVDGRYVAGEMYQYDAGKYGVLIWDTKTETPIWQQIYTAHKDEVSDFFRGIREITFLPDGSLIVSSETPGSKPSTTYINKQVTSHFLYEGEETVYCLEPDGTIRWVAEITYPQQFYGIYLKDMTYKERPAVYCCIGNVVQILAADTGETLLRVDLPAPMIFAITGNKAMVCVLTDGQIAYYAYEQGVLMTEEAAIEDLICADWYDDICVQQEGADRILLYRLGRYDQSWQELEECLEYWSGNYSTEAGLLIRDDGVLRFYGVEQAECLWTMTEDPDVDWEPLGQNAAGDAFLMADKWGEKLAAIDLADGMTTMKSLPYRSTSDYAYENGTLFYYSYYDRCVVALGDDGQDQVFPVPETSEGYYWQVIPGPDGQEFLLREEETYELLTKDGELLPVEQPETRTILWQPDSSGFFVMGDAAISICDRQMSPLVQISGDGMAPKSMKVYEDQLLVFYDTGKLCRYDRITGTLLGTTELQAANSLYDVKWGLSAPGEATLFVGDDLFLLDTETWQVRTRIARCVGYVPGLQTVFARGYAGSDYSLGMFRLRNYEELMELAKEQLGGLELTEQQKQLYGISE